MFYSLGSGILFLMFYDFIEMGNFVLLSQQRFPFNEQYGSVY